MIGSSANVEDVGGVQISEGVDHVEVSVQVEVEVMVVVVFNR